jgi:hypothetical protein
MKYASAILVCTALAMPAHGVSSVTETRVADPRLPCNQQPLCLSELKMDLNNNGKIDTIRAIKTDNFKYFFIDIQFDNGQKNSPLWAEFDSVTDTVTLENRAAGENAICVNWNADKGCGYLSSGPNNSPFAVKHSRLGTFILFYNQYTKQSKQSMRPEFTTHFVPTSGRIEEEKDVKPAPRCNGIKDCLERDKKEITMSDLRTELDPAPPPLPVSYDVEVVSDPCFTYVSSKKSECAGSRIKARGENQKK